MSEQERKSAKCYQHPEVEATAYCRSCGRPLCAECQRTSMGTIYCPEHAPAPEFPRPGVQEKTSREGLPSPGLAFVLGFIPGVGAIYNGQYAKGIVHVIVLGTLISLASSAALEGLRPLFGLLVPAWFFYMAFEAYHTASRRRQGLPVDEFSSLVPLRCGGSRSLAGPVLLIVLGTFFLAMNLKPEWLREVARWWPVLLIAVGVYLLLARLRSGPTTGSAGPVSNDRHPGAEDS